MISANVSKILFSCFFVLIASSPLVFGNEDPAMQLDCTIDWSQDTTVIVNENEATAHGTGTKNVTFSIEDKTEGDEAEKNYTKLEIGKGVYHLQLFPNAGDKNLHLLNLRSYPTGEKGSSSESAIRARVEKEKQNFALSYRDNPKPASTTEPTIETIIDINCTLVAKK